ncbi:MAG TPA: cupin domain-containing protein, partial [Limnochordia bacterium]
TIRNAEKPADLAYDWGEIRWLCNGKIDPDAQMTFGVVHIEPGKSNPRHYHPNCEEYIFVLSGECDHSLGDETVHLSAGDMLRIPQGVMHHAVNTGRERVRMVIVYSSPDRQTVGEGL